MNSGRAVPELAEPYLRGVLATAGLDVEYIRSEKDTVYYLDGRGEEVAVLDVVGGYGSLLLGHNHPDINAYAVELLNSGVPVHAQFSKHPYANELADALNRILHRELDTEQRFYAIFTNSGAEAIEAAVKNAELDRQLRLADLTTRIDTDIETARAAVASGAAALPEGHTDVDALAEGVRSDNAARLAAGPLFLALDDGFHGKLVGSVQYTHNEVYRSPFSALAAQARFVPPNDAAALRAAVAAEDARLDTLTVVDGQVLRTAVPFSLFCALLVEPVQGEGGIHELTAEFAEQVRLVSQEIDCPVIVDEIQSGMGRTGAFLSSAQIGLEGDYYTLAKTLGGGVAKAGVMLLRENRYREAFEMVHSSTFAKDAFSCLLGSRVLEILEADEGAVYRRAAERGERLRRMLDLLVEDFPQVLREARGRGLILGLEFADQSEAASEEIREKARSGFFGYHLAGYLLREHRIRVFPTASAMQTLRFEPSVYITDAEIDRLEQGLRELCRLLRDQDPKVFEF